MFKETEETEGFNDDGLWVAEGSVERLEGLGRGEWLGQIWDCMVDKKLKKMGSWGDSDGWWVGNMLGLVLMVFQRWMSS